MLRDPVADWRELSELYEQAESLKGSELDAFFSGVGRDARHLIPDLERMLEAKVRMAAEGFLEVMPAVPVVSERSSIEWGAGRRIGAYRLVRHIGSGGMAEVWLADRVDGAFERQVAIKLLFNHPMRAHRDTFVERFKRERDILASLDHPHIARLQDAGVTSESQPWLALEYVQGEPITEWCDRTRLSIRERVMVFRQVLLAVEHAHANLIIHRDVKPSNVLVTGQGVVKLLDFGIAKLIEAGDAATTDTLLTRDAGRPLTIQYASPEQLLGKPLTTASDIYSLGVLLYELLCGERPYELLRASAARIEEAILEIEPRAPSRRAASAAVLASRGSPVSGLSRLIGTDLDAAVLKALRKAPGERYGSVEALRSDLERWLAGEVVLARPPSRIDKAVKFVRRHQLGVGLGAFAVATLLLVTGAAVWLGLQARADSLRASTSRDFLLEMFREADPYQARGATVTARELLATGKRRALTLQDQPELQGELLAAIGEVQGYLGDLTVADETLEAVVALARERGDQRGATLGQLVLAWNALLLGDEARSRTLLAAARPMLMARPRDHQLHVRHDEAQGWLALNTRKPDAAYAAFSSGLAHAEQAFGSHDTRTIDLLVSLSAAARAAGKLDVAEAHVTEAASRLSKGTSHFELDMERVALDADRGKYQLAARHLGELRERCDREVGLKVGVCVSLRVRQASYQLRMGMVTQALELAPGLVQQATGMEESPRRQFESLLSACRVLAANGKLPRESELRERLVGVSMSGDDVKLPAEYKIHGMHAEAEIRLREGDVVAARQWLERAARVRRTLDEAESDPALQGREQLLLGLSAQIRGEHHEALVALAQAVEVYERAHGASHSVPLLYGLNRIPSLRALGERAEALRLIDAALPTLRANFGPSAPVVRAVERERAHFVGSGPAHPADAHASVFFFT